MTESSVETEIKIFKDLNFEILKRGDLNAILNSISSINLNVIVIDYRYFKLFATNDTSYQVVINHIKNNLNEILTTYPTFTVHACMKSLSITDAEKHRNFIYDVSKTFKEEYPDKLQECFIYNAPFIFSRVYDIIRIFIDKPTQKKIIMV